MNKEQLRKELEDCWAECSKEVFAQVNRGNWKESGLIAARDKWIATRLAALGDGKPESLFTDKVHHGEMKKGWQESILGVPQPKKVDDGQEGKGLEFVGKVGLFNLYKGTGLPSAVTGGVKPKVITLCGSTRFGQAFQDANLHETLKGNIVLSIGCNMKSDHQLFGDLPEQRLKEIKIELDELHKRKIDLSDEILVLDVGGYIGESTRSEIDYAVKRGLPIRYLSLEEPKAKPAQGKE